MAGCCLARAGGAGDENMLAQFLAVEADAMPLQMATLLHDVPQVNSVVRPGGFNIEAEGHLFAQFQAGDFFLWHTGQHTDFCCRKPSAQAEGIPQNWPGIQKKQSTAGLEIVLDVQGRNKRRRGLVVGQRPGIEWSESVFVPLTDSDQCIFQKGEIQFVGRPKIDGGFVQAFGFAMTDARQERLGYVLHIILDNFILFFFCFPYV